ncbi:MAG: hypothetical protein V4691_04725 [Pseudomonadota bacterium]
MANLLDFLPSFKTVARQDGNRRSVSDTDLQKTFYQSIEKTRAFQDCKTEDERKSLKLCGFSAARMFKAVAKKDDKRDLSSIEYDNCVAKLKNSIYDYGNGLIAFTTDNRDTQATLKLLLRSYGVDYTIHDPNDEAFKGMY